MHFINCKIFTIAALNLGEKVYVIYRAYLRAKMLIYLAWKALISLLLAKKITILKTYIDFTNVFSKESAIKLSQRSNINKICNWLKAW